MSKRDELSRELSPLERDIALLAESRLDNQNSENARANLVRRYITHRFLTASEKRLARDLARRIRDGRPRGYLVPRNGGGKVAHLWKGNDTVCRMASTGGLKLRKYDVVSDAGERSICKMCSHVNQSFRQDQQLERRRAAYRKQRAIDEANDRRTMTEHADRLGLPLPPKL